MIRYAIPNFTEQPGYPVRTFSGLQALPIRPPVVTMAGYNSIGDGGGGTFYWVPGDATPTVASIVMQPTNGDLGRYFRIYSGPLNVLWFGAVGDNSTDNTAAIQVAANYAITLGGGEIWFPPGIFLISSEIAVNDKSVNFRGSGSAATNLRTTSSTANIFHFTGTAFDCSVQDMRLTSAAATPTAGAAIYSDNGVGAIYVDTVRIESTFNGMEMLNTPNSGISGSAQVSNTNFASIVNDSFHINGVSTLFLTNVSTFANQSGNNRAGIYQVAGGGIYCDNCAFGGSVHGIVIQPSGSGIAITDLFFANVDVDSCTGDAWVFDTVTNGGTIDCVKIATSRAGFSVGHGILIEGSGCRDITVNGFTSQKNSKDGVHITSGNDINLIGFVGANNSSLGAGFSAVNVSGGTDIAVIGGSSTVYETQSASQDNGVNIANTFSGTLLVDGFNARAGWTLNAILNSSTSTNIKIVNCAGFNPRGYSLPALGSSPASYTAGVSDEQIILQGGTTSLINYNGQNTLLSSPCTFVLPAGQTAAITYSVKPNIVVIAT